MHEHHPPVQMVRGKFLKHTACNSFYNYLDKSYCFMMPSLCCLTLVLHSQTAFARRERVWYNDYARLVQPPPPRNWEINNCISYPCHRATARIQLSCTWRRPSWLKRRTLQLLHLSRYVNARLHYCWYSCSLLAKAVRLARTLQAVRNSMTKGIAVLPVILTFSPLSHLHSLENWMAWQQKWISTHVATTGILHTHTHAICLLFMLTRMSLSVVTVCVHVVTCMCACACTCAQ